MVKTKAVVWVECESIHAPYGRFQTELMVPAVRNKRGPRAISSGGWLWWLVGRPGHFCYRQRDLRSRYIRTTLEPILRDLLYPTLNPFEEDPLKMTVS